MNYYVVDAFTDEVFKGNPACVCILDKRLSDDILQSIAYENNLPETAFLLIENGEYNLRWFTREFEIDLCGHGTLAAAFVVFNFVNLDAQAIHFDTLSGRLTVTKTDHMYQMDFPLRQPEQSQITPDIINALGFEPAKVYINRDIFVVTDSPDFVAAYTPDYDKLASISDCLGVVITAKGEKCDFVSRYFCTELKEEDPVTGSAHCALVSIWRDALNKNSFYAKQLSDRGGTLYCSIDNDRVKISGNAVLFSKGEIFL